MEFVIFLFIFFVGGGWLIGRSAGNGLFPKTNNDFTTKPGATIINNYKTENHVHISKEDMKALHESKF